MERDATTGLDSGVIGGIVARASDADGYAAFRSQGERCHWCTQPIRLAGSTRIIERETGELVAHFASMELPEGEYLKACGTRRATRCPACAQLYQGDARALITSGLIGAKGIPETVRRHPMIFLTLTGPSFGAVHARSENGGPCHARGPGHCPHGRAVSCLLRHKENDVRVGEALCPDCYDYEGAVLFNASVSELWRRTSIYATRHLAKLVGLSAHELLSIVRLSYAKVFEFQRRGVVHLHAVVRLDGIDGEAPPEMLSASLLALALRIGASQASAPYPRNRGEARWGHEFAVKPLLDGADEDRAKIANYVAKYATKGSDNDGALDSRIRSEVDLAARNLPMQLRRMAETAWRLGGAEELASLHLRRWCHTLGLRSHFLTKSRRFSTTFRALRAARQAYQRAERLGRAGIPVDLSAGAVVVVGEWTYLGRGWKSRAEAYLAASEAQRAEEARRFARDAIDTEQAA